MTAPTDRQSVDFHGLYRRLDEIDEALNGDAGLDPEKRRRVLAERARALSQSRESAPTETIGVLAFRVGGERYAVVISEVEQVLEADGVSALPGAPARVLGAMMARTQIVPVLDLRQLLGTPRGGMSDLTRVVVVVTPEGLVGLAAEEVEGRVDLVTAELTEAGSGPFLFLGRDRLAVLDLARLGERQDA
ncbi:MAG: chemotaxis protein CheW [Myxococcaceae bacterium]